MKFKVGDIVKVLDVKNGRLTIHSSMIKNIGQNCMVIGVFADHYIIKGVNGRSYYYFPEYLEKVYSTTHKLIKYLI